MTPATKGRLVAAIALPLLILNIAAAHAAPAQATLDRFIASAGDMTLTWTQYRR